MPTATAYDSLVIGALLERNARYRPDHLALVAPCGERELRLTWRELDAYVNRHAHVLSGLGVRHGDRVASLLTNGVELVTLYWACAKLGAVAVPLSPLLTATGLASLLRDAAPRALVSSSRQRDMLDAVRGPQRCAWLLVDAAPADRAAGYLDFAALRADASAAPIDARVHPDDLLTLMYTSGTTGLPKGIPHTHFIRAMYALTMASAWRIEPASVVLHTGALVFNGAMTTLLPALMMGATFVVARQFDAEAFIATVARERVTHTMVVPSQLMAILDAPGCDPARLASLGMLLSLGAPLPVERKEQLERLLPGRLHELYGLTEGFVTILDRDDARRKMGSVGVPPPFYTVRIVDAEGRDLPAGKVGEIVGRGPITVAGYYGREQETAAAFREGWLHTGDMGYVDEDGYLFLVDRMKDMIDSGGVKVYPRDIEEIAARHPAVREVAVFGVPHVKWGETPVAAVVLRAGAQCSAETLCAWINERVAARYQRVDRVLLLDDFPRNAAGKTLKRELRAPFWNART